MASSSLAGLGSLGSADPGKLLYAMRVALSKADGLIRKSQESANAGDISLALKYEAEAKAAVAVAEANVKAVRGMRSLVPPDYSKAVLRAQDAVRALDSYTKRAVEQQAAAAAAAPSRAELLYANWPPGRASQDRWSSDREYGPEEPPSRADLVYAGIPRGGVSGLKQRRRRRRR